MTQNTKNHQTSFPENLLIETTTRCNLRCKQCARLVNKYALADMEMAIFNRLMPLFPHVREVALYGHGETFLHKRFFEMLEVLKKHNIFVYVTTNGTLLTEEVAERLVDLKLDRLSFSLDAATPQLFHEIRRGADFEAILENIRRLNRIKKRLHRDDKPVLSIMYCAMKSNIQELPKLVRLADQLNMTHGIAVMNIEEYEGAAGEGLLHHPELAQGYLNEANMLAQKLALPFDMSNIFRIELQPVQLRIWNKLYRNYREFQRSFNRISLFKTKAIRVFERAKNLITPHPPTPEKSSGPTSSSSEMIRVKNCRDPWEFMFINVHGDVRVCCVSDRIMGNVRDDDVVKIWNNNLYQEFRGRILTPEPPEECQTCPMRGWHFTPI